VWKGLNINTNVNLNSIQVSKRRKCFVYIHFISPVSFFKSYNYSAMYLVVGLEDSADTIIESADSVK
jgi:hypothetical protein